MSRLHPVPRRAHRHLIRAAAVGVTLVLAPLLPASSALHADAPAVAVTGLARGARGDAVRTVQEALVNQGVAVAGGVDGIFGAGTESAVKEFQAEQGIAATGVVDDATALALGLASSPLLGLTQGARSDAVATLQRKLTDAGFTPQGGADGIFGPSTTTQLKAFQSAQGLAASGIVDAATAGALGAVTVSDSSGGGGDADTAPEGDSAAPAASRFVGLKIGATGAGVKELQQILIGAGFEVVGGADGIFGVLTANALSSFQYSRQLKANAIVDEATAAALVDVAPAGGSGGSTAPPGNGGVTPLVGLQYGATGSAVKDVQRALIDAGIAVRGGADGVFGVATQAALKQFQTANGLPASGKVDEATAAKLTAAGGANGVTRPSPLAGLKVGALGTAVKQLQQALIDAGVTVRGGADGIFGPATNNALKEFQTSQGLAASGVVDAATIAALASPKAPVAQPAAQGGYPAYGEKGSRVLALQSALVNAGITVRGGVDGDFGGGTSAAVMEFQRQQGLSVTGKVNDATASALGLAKAPAPAAPDPSTVRLAAFPVQAQCYYGDSWGYGRSGGRTHLGVDIIAAEGQEVYAVADGKISKVYHDYPGALAGNALRLTTGDGTYFFYAHLSAFADGIELGVPVTAGQLIGYVGSTGNSGTPHLHFEVHPQGGAAVNPYPLVKAIDAC